MIGCFQLPFTAESTPETAFDALPRFNAEAGDESETWARMVRLWHSFPSHSSCRAETNVDYSEEENQKTSP